MQIKPGGARLGIDVVQSYIKHFGEGLVATDGVVYTAIATFGTTPVEVLNELVNPGFNMQLQEIEVGFTPRLAGLNGSFVGSLIYHWDMREEWFDAFGGANVGTMRTGGWINIAGTYAKSTGTVVAVEDTFSGYVPVGSVPHAPVRVRLTAQALVPNSTGRVKNSSYIQLFGQVIPGV